MTQIKLCIAIPTFNRNDLLKAAVDALLPQLRDDCEILILDNCSDIPISETLKSILETHGRQIRVHRNEANIGGNANIARCFELTDADWMWLLSDDDQVAVDAVAVIYKAMAQFPSAVYFNFPLQGHIRESCIQTAGLTQFIDAIDFYGDLSLISTNVFKCERFKPQLQHAYRFGYSCAPHLAMVLRSLGTDGVACLHNAHVILGNAANPDNTGWSWLPFALSRMTLLDMPLSDHERRTLARKIIGSKPILLHVTTLLILQSHYFNKRAESLYLYDQISCRYFYYGDWFTRNVLLRLFRILIVFPFFGYGLLRFVRRESELEKLGRSDLLLRI